MSQPFLGQVQCFSFSFAPKDWAACNGQLLSIQQNSALFSLLGTTYGGDGTTDFALPNLASRIILHVGEDYNLGQSAGTETAAINDVPDHTHVINASSSTAVSNSPQGNFLGAAPIYTQRNSGGGYWSYLNEITISKDGGGGGDSFNIVQPIIAVNWCIALKGIYPSRN